MHGVSNRRKIGKSHLCAMMSTYLIINTFTFLTNLGLCDIYPEARVFYVEIKAFLFGCFGQSQTYAYIPTILRNYVNPTHWWRVKITMVSWGY